MNKKADVVLIPGAKVDGSHPSSILKSRLVESIVYIRKNPKVYVIVSGGEGKDERFTEAEIMNKFLLKNKVVDKNFILKEEKSIDTYENIKNSILIVKRKNIINPKLMIITSEYHTFRVKMIAKSLNIRAYTIPSHVSYELLPVCIINEYFSIIKMFLQIYLGIFTA
jgi:uncharacterized SAM-binding protein YcdF (DUF218 family)